MNSTGVTPNYIHDYAIVCSFSAILIVSAVVISITILILVRRTKPRLHTIRHLLMCNTCVASILYCIVQINNYVFLFFVPSVTSNIYCRWRAYFTYFTLCAVTYSFLIQAISRLFIAVFSTKYKCLVTFKTHYILVIIQWFTVTIIPISVVVTKDVYYRPMKFCWVPMKKIIHTSYILIACYIIPTLSICIIYIFIFYHIKQAKKGARHLLRVLHGERRDFQLLRNILILLSIYLMGGIPLVLYVLSSNRILYLIGIVTISLTVAAEKVCTILLDQELRQIITKLLSRMKRIAPLDNTNTRPGYQEKLPHIQRAMTQPQPNTENT
ncbi:unnamed protein product [Rotaria sp. Silwood2]|nr:unnamed protein product [Rotaria sp. Silwood2]CAF3339729.1 unnamed protein product [Rotaria sp. Silwood2]CAF4019784.1 unnamed protein product [Rotaria sp. Silwood2]CAF4156606.1 unnamed protein product [Rotaria sp. Silwood2]CAF4398835.1 unnamed protein product [Rotaria sp. Silwood2]